MITTKPKIGDKEIISGAQIGRGHRKYIKRSCRTCGSEDLVELHKYRKGLSRICFICRQKNSRRVLTAKQILEKPCRHCGQSGFIRIDEDGYPHCLCGKVIYA